MKRKRIKKTKNSYLAATSFTLTEILAVIGIMAIIAGIILGAYKYTAQKAQYNSCISIMSQIEVALKAYKNQTGYYPPRPNGGDFIVDPTDKTLLEFLPNYQAWVSEGIIAPNDLRAGIDNRRLLDPYEQPFWYRCPGYHNRMGFDLESGGPDLFFGYSATSGFAVGFEAEFDRDRDPSFGVNDKHSTIAYPRKQKDNIKNWD